MNWRKVFWAVVAPKCNGLRSSNSYWHPRSYRALKVDKIWKMWKQVSIKKHISASQIVLSWQDLHQNEALIYSYIWSQLWLWNMYILCKTQSPVCPQQKWQCCWDLYQNDAHSVLFSDDINIVADITYKFVAIWLWNRYVWNIKISVKLSHPSLLNQRDSSVGTYPKWCTCQCRLSKCCHF